MRDACNGRFEAGKPSWRGCCRTTSCGGAICRSIPAFTPIAASNSRPCNARKRRLDERHRRQGRRHRVGRCAASRCARPRPAPSNAERGRRRRRIAVGVADTIVVRRGGISRPETQIHVHDRYGVLVAVIDMGWRDHLVGVDFEGAHRWTDPRQRHWDVERFTRLPEFGWNDFRVTSRMVREAPRLILNRVGAALIARGCPKTW